MSSTKEGSPSPRFMAAASPLSTECLSLSLQSQTVEWKTRPGRGGRGRGRRRSRELPRAARGGGALGSAEPRALSLRLSGAASFVFLASGDQSQLDWPNLGSAPSRGWASPIKRDGEPGFPRRSLSGF